MKISKQLLNGILLGLTVGAVSSCTLFEDVLGDNEPQKKERKCKEHKGDGDTYDCPACGLG